MDNKFLSIEPKKDTTITRKRHIERGAISRAIYMITDLFDTTEPLKKALRDISVSILKNDRKEDVVILKDMLKLSYDISLISEKNFSILIEAIDQMKNFEGLKSSEGLNIEQVLQIVDTEDIDTNVSVFKKDLETSEILKNQTDDTIRYEEAKQLHVAEGYQKDTKTVKDADSIHEPQKTITPKPATSTVTTLDIGTRRKKILEIVKSKGQATIHEFIQSIQGCSSKTIQRELTSLVLSGTLKKTGERRWSKYSIR